MKSILTATLIIISVSLQAQNIFDNKLSQEKREQDLLNFIKSDVDLYSHYKSGKKNLTTAKTLGVVSLVFLAADVAFIFGIHASNDLSSAIGFAVSFFASSLVAAVTGTIGLILQSKGKGKIRDVMDFADREVEREFGGELNFQSTSNGVGIVLTF